MFKPGVDKAAVATRTNMSRHQPKIDRVPPRERLLLTVEESGFALREGSARRMNESSWGEGGRGGNKGEVEERREADELNGREDEERRIDGRESGNENDVKDGRQGKSQEVMRVVEGREIRRDYEGGKQFWAKEDERKGTRCTSNERKGDGSRRDGSGGAKDEQDKTLTVAFERAKVLAAMDSCSHPATTRDHPHPPTASVFGLVAPSPGDHHIRQPALKVVDVKECAALAVAKGAYGGARPKMNVLVLGEARARTGAWSALGKSCWCVRRRSCGRVSEGGLLEPELRTVGVLMVRFRTKDFRLFPGATFGRSAGSTGRADLLRR
ncbi:hypothetical protein B0H14DRAFT_2594376 [Mycena olivaceomarginata]|nr:hypothetical protein B0H14DRAFT_2594376 [Mycena olivaceomarginata]